MNRDKEEKIRQRAYEIWEREGRPHGHEAEHWEKATREIETNEGKDGLNGDIPSTGSASAGTMDTAEENVAGRRTRAAKRAENGTVKRGRGG